MDLIISRNDVPVDEEGRVQDLSSIKSSISPPGSGWMSKRSFSIKKEKSEMNQSVNRTNIDGGVEDLGEPSSGKSSQGGKKTESQGFSSNEEQQTVRWHPSLVHRASFSSLSHKKVQMFQTISLEFCRVLLAMWRGGN